MKRLISWIVAITFIATLLTACKTGQQTTSNALPAWLQEKTTSLSEVYSSITLFEYQGENYYSVFVKGPNRSYDMNRATIYKSNGEVYFTTGGLKKQSEEEQQFYSQATSKGIVWQSPLAAQDNKK